MTNLNLIVLSYHKFNEEYNEYPFSRTYDQFRHDIDKKEYDLITIDDADASIIKACNILKLYNRRAKLFIPTALVGTPGYCTWDEIRELSHDHDIETHGHDHVRLDKLSLLDVGRNIKASLDLISTFTMKKPRFFVAPWNAYSDDVDMVCDDYGLQAIKNRIDIKNNSK